MKPGASQHQNAIESLEPRFLLSVARPAYNTGTGFFVLNGNVYDANGNEFVIRGIKRAAYKLSIERAQVDREVDVGA